MDRSLAALSLSSLANARMGTFDPLPPVLNGRYRVSNQALIFLAEDRW
jgi:hypothetical protein